MALIYVTQKLKVRFQSALHKPLFLGWILGKMSARIAVLKINQEGLKGLFTCFREMKERKREKEEEKRGGEKRETERARVGDGEKGVQSQRRMEGGEMKEERGERRVRV